MAKSSMDSPLPNRSQKYRQVIGDGSAMQGRPPSVPGPRIGPGVEGRRVRAEYDRAGRGGNGPPAGGNDRSDD